MSWAEIKKAINSRFSEMSLDKMFGLQFVSQHEMQTSAVGSEVNYDVTGINGIALFSGAQTNITVPTFEVKIKDNNTYKVIGYGGIWCTNTNQLNFPGVSIIPLDAKKEYRFTCKGSAIKGYVTIYAWGGGV